MRIMQKLTGAMTAIIVIAVSSAALASVSFVSGEVTGTWEADSIIVTGAVNVPSGEMLTIEPGVNVFFLDYFAFEIKDNAVLHAVGTESDYIRFVPFNDGDRTLGLDFINASSSSILEYVHIADALTSGIHLNNSGITVRNSLIEDNEAPTGSIGGGGIEILNNSSALIENNVIRNNYSADYGGGIYIDNSSPVVTGNIIENNLAGYYGSAAGGGIAVYGNSNPEITFNSITSNSVNPVGNFFVRRGYGGAIYYSGESSGLISDNHIFDNVVDSEPQTETFGGGLYITGASPMVENNVIAYNQAQGNDGGGIFLYNSNSTFINNTVSFNSAGDFGGAVYSQNSNPTFINSILYFNQDSTGNEIWTENSYVAVYFSDIQGGWQGQGNIDIDPMFRDNENGDFHLMSTMCGDSYDSPAIDAGDSSIFDNYLNCDAGLGTERSDLGAYGGQGTPTTDINDPVEDLVPESFLLAQNYPNPFNASTSIEFSLENGADVTVEVFDVLGKKVQTLADGHRSAGNHMVTWDASKQSTGVYFYRITADGSTETRKMSLLK
ncbi:MAG: right-handed parallel beta-helix repeat-containing protein [candidate division Zixibacteria bacterium]